MTLTTHDILKQVADAHPEFRDMKSPLLRDLSAMVLVAKGEIPGATEPIEAHPFGMSPAQLVLPQCHREEVEMFIRVAKCLDMEKNTISPEEFLQVLRLLPTLFPNINRKQTLRVKVMAGAPPEELQALLEHINAGLTDPDYNIVLNYPVEIEVVSGNAPRWSEEEIRAANDKLVAKGGQGLEELILMLTEKS